MPLTSPAFFSARWRIFHERRSRTVVHHSCLNRGSIYERYHLFSEANEIYGLDLSSSNTSHKYSSFVDRSIDFYPRGKPLFLHVCVRSCINFVVMIPTFFLESCHAFWKISRSSNIWSFLIRGTKGRVRLGGEFSITSIEFLDDFREDLREKGRYLRGKVFNDGRG